MNARPASNLSLVARAAVLALAGLPPPGWAQAEPATQTVEVTAQGRRQEVLQVPISLQLIGPDQIAKLGASNLAEVASFVPGLSIDATEPTQPNYNLRGLGSSDFGIGTDSPVGIYVNGVYTGKTGGALLNFNDVKRIEVLKGPQGTLFGRNSAGGAISVITNEPTSSFSASGLVRLGNHGSTHAEALLNQPLSDDLALRFSAVGQRSDGWTTNVTTGQKAPQENTWGLRMGLRWAASDSTSAVVTWEHEDLDQRPRPVWTVLTGTPTFDADPATFVDPRKQPLRNDVVDGRENRQFDGLTLRVDHELAGATFTSTTGWRQFRSENLQDNDGTDNIASHLSTGNFEKSTSWQQEFRLAGKTSSMDWLLGASLYADKAKQTSQINTYSDSLDTLLPMALFAQGIMQPDGTPIPPPFATLNGIAQLAGIPGINLLGQTWQEGIQNTGDFKAYALYGDAIWHVTPQTNLTAGVRFTLDQKKFSWYNPLRSAPGLDPQLAVFSPEFFQQLVALGALDPDSAGLLTALVQGLQFSNIEFNNAAWATAPQSTSQSWRNLSPRLVIDHHLSRDTMVFGSVTRGYQAGGFNAVSTEANGGRFEPETVTNYEIGVKGRVPGAGLSYSASVFHYLFKNLQSITLDQTLPIPAYVVTVSDVQATGADLEAQWQATQNLRLFGSAEFIDQTYKRQANLAGGANDLTGQPFGTPSSTIAAGIDLTWPLATGLANWTLQGSAQSATRCNDDSATQGTCLTTPTFRVGEARQRVDTRLGWEAGSKQWGLALVVNNLFDKQYVNWLSNLSAPVGAPYYAAVTEPRRIQIEFKAKL